MSLPVLHLCRFAFQTQDVRIAGSEVDGGASISGISEPTQTDGGGYWLADYSNGNFGNRDNDGRETTLAWRATQQLFNGGRQQVVLFCDRWHQPVQPVHRPRRAGRYHPLDPLSLQPFTVAAVTAVVNGEMDGLNATIIEITFTGEKPLIGGERFTYVHETWGERCAQIESIEEISGGYRIAFLPSIRGGIAAGQALDFDNPRCVMRRTSQPSNAITLGIFAQNMSLQLVEDMRQPASSS
jgi:hypothetical protein